MNTHTGEITRFQTPAAAKAAGFDLEIPDEKVQAVQGMSRRERRRWAAEVREAARDASHRSRKRYKVRERASR